MLGKYAIAIELNAVVIINLDEMFRGMFIPHYYDSESKGPIEANNLVVKKLVNGDLYFESSHGSRSNYPYANATGDLFELRAYRTVLYKIDGKYCISNYCGIVEYKTYDEIVYGYQYRLTNVIDNGSELIGIDHKISDSPYQELKEQYDSWCKMQVFYRNRLAKIQLINKEPDCDEIFTDEYKSILYGTSDDQNLDLYTTYCTFSTEWQHIMRLNLHQKIVLHHAFFDGIIECIYLSENYYIDERAFTDCLICNLYIDSDVSNLDCFKTALIEAVHIDQNNRHFYCDEIGIYSSVDHKRIINFYRSEV